MSAPVSATITSAVVLEIIVCYREAQFDYLMVKNDEVALLYYVATLVAKEYVIYNAPRSTAHSTAHPTPTGLLQVPGFGASTLVGPGNKK